MSSLSTVLWVAGAFCAFAWTASLVSKDFSWVDRGWSIVPAAYVVIFAGFGHWNDARLNVMAVLAVTWGLRLTFNFARKGGYSGVEDYRWAVLRAKMNGWQFQLFNLFFIVLYQNAILVLIALPAYTAFQHRGSFTVLDGVLVAVFVVCLIGETVADQQQWNFHQNKAASLAAGRTPSAQFLQSGLFRYSRHPNYFFEIAQWWVLFGFGAVAANCVLQWTVLGPVLLTLLFVGSTRFTESITLSKYPPYAQYQSTTSAVIPWRARRLSDSGVTAPNANDVN